MQVRECFCLIFCVVHLGFDLETTLPVVDALQGSRCCRSQGFDSVARQSSLHASQVRSSVLLTGGVALFSVLLLLFIYGWMCCVCELLGCPIVNMQISLHFFLYFKTFMYAATHELLQWFLVFYCSALTSWAQIPKKCSLLQTKRCCCLTPASSNITVYGWRVVAESLESAHLPLIEDTICGSLPVRALNFGQGAVWPRELPVHLRTAPADVFVSGERRRSSLYSRAGNLKS